MIKHVYLYKLKDRSQAEEIAAKLMTMKDRIPSVYDVETGIDFIGAGSSFDLMELVVCRNMDDFRAFCTDAYHKFTEGYKVDFDDGVAAE